MAVFTEIRLKDQVSKTAKAMSMSISNLSKAFRDSDAKSFESEISRATKEMERLRKITESQTEATKDFGNATKSAFNNSISAGNKLLNVYAGLEVAAKGLSAVKDVGTVSLGGALDLGQFERQFQARLGSNAVGTALFDSLKEQAKDSAFSLQDLTQNTSSFLSMVSNKKQLDKLNQFAEQLAVFDTTGQGLSGAGFSIKEAMGGDIVSLAERFNMSKGLIRSLGIDEMGKKGDIDGFITQFEKLLEMQKMGKGAYEKMLGDPKTQLNMFKSNLETSLAEAGLSAVEKLAPITSKLNEWLKTDNATELFTGISVGMSNAVDYAIRKVEELKSYFLGLGSQIAPAFTEISGFIGSTFDQLFSVQGAFGSIGTSLASIFSSKGFVASARFVISTFSSISKVVSGVAKYISDLNNRFSFLLPTVTSVVVGFTVFKTVNSSLQSGIEGIKNAISSAQMAMTTLTSATKAATAAQTAFNIAQKANIIGAVTSAVLGLVAALGSLFTAMKSVTDYASQAQSVADATANTGTSADIKRAKELGISTASYLDIKNSYNEYNTAINSLKGNKNAFDKAKARYENYVDPVSGTSNIWSDKGKAGKKAAADALEEAAKNMGYKYVRTTDQVIRITENLSGHKNDINDLALERDKVRSEKLTAAQELEATKNKLNEMTFDSSFDGSSFNVNEVGSVNKINDTVDIASEDLKYMRDIAEQEVINEFTTKMVVPQFSVTFGDVRETADIDDIVSKLKSVLADGIENSPSMVHI